MRPRKGRPPGCPRGLGLGRPVSRVLSAARVRFTALRLPSRQPAAGRSSLWAAALPRGSCGLPGARRGRAAPWIPKDRRPCLALLPAGVAWPRPLLAAPVVSYTTVSPLPRLAPGRSVSVALSAGRPARGLPGAVLCGARTFLSRPNRPRSPDQPTAASIIPRLAGRRTTSETLRTSEVIAANLHLTSGVHTRFQRQAPGRARVKSTDNVTGGHGSIKR